MDEFLKAQGFQEHSNTWYRGTVTVEWKADEDFFDVEVNYYGKYFQPNGDNAWLNITDSLYGPYDAVTHKIGMLVEYVEEGV